MTVLRMLVEPFRKVCRGGLWSGRPARGAEKAICEEAGGIATPQPAGYVYISGQCASAHRTELIRMMLHYETRARARNPERRILSIEKQSDSTVVMTTASQFAHELGVALRLTYRGSLDVQYSDDACVAHVYWWR